MGTKYFFLKFEYEIDMQIPTQIIKLVLEDSSVIKINKELNFDFGQIILGDANSSINEIIKDYNFSNIYFLETPGVLEISNNKITINGWGKEEFLYYQELRDSIKEFLKLIIDAGKEIMEQGKSYNEMIQELIAFTNDFKNDIKFDDKSKIELVKLKINYAFKLAVEELSKLYSNNNSENSKKVLQLDIETRLYNNAIEEINQHPMKDTPFIGTFINHFVVTNANNYKLKLFEIKDEIFMTELEITEIVENARINVLNKILD